MANETLELLYRRVLGDALVSKADGDKLEALYEKLGLPDGNEERDAAEAELMDKLQYVVEQVDNANSKAHRTIVSVKGNPNPDIRGRIVTTITYSDDSVELIYQTPEEVEAGKAIVEQEIAESKAPSPRVADVLRAIDSNLNAAYEMTRGLTQGEMHELGQYVKPEDKQYLMALESHERDEAAQRVREASGIV
jgi:hypothetical protein